MSVTVVLNPTLTFANFQTAAFTVRNTVEVCMQSHQHYRVIFPPMVPLNVSTNITFPLFWNIVFSLRNIITTTLKLQVRSQKFSKNFSVTFLYSTFFTKLLYEPFPFALHTTDHLFAQPSLAGLRVNFRTYGKHSPLSSTNIPQRN